MIYWTVLQMLGILCTDFYYYNNAVEDLLFTCFL